MKVEVTYTEEWRRKAVVEVDEEALRKWLGESPLADGPLGPWTGEITRDHLIAWLNETWDDQWGNRWHPGTRPGADDEFQYLDVESAKPTGKA